MPRINGQNVTVYSKLNIEGQLFVNGVEYTVAGDTPIGNQNYTTLRNVAVDSAYFQGEEIVASGGAIPSNFQGTRLKSINITQNLSINGQVVANPIEPPFDGFIFDNSLRTPTNPPTISGAFNQTITGPGASVYGTAIAVDSLVREIGNGEIYQVEFLCNSNINSELFIGVVDNGFDLSADKVPGDATQPAATTSVGYTPTGSLLNNFSVGTGNVPVASYASGIYLQFVFDDPAEELRVYRQGVLQWTFDLSVVTINTGFRPAIGAESSSNSATCNVVGPFNNTIAGAQPWAVLP